VPAQVATRSPWSVSARIEFFGDLTRLTDFLDHDEAIAL
jgi:hypothetical protein